MGRSRRPDRGVHLCDRHGRSVRLPQGHRSGIEPRLPAVDGHSAVDRVPGVEANGARGSRTDSAEHARRGRRGSDRRYRRRWPRSIHLADRYRQSARRTGQCHSRPPGPPHVRTGICHGGPDRPRSRRRTRRRRRSNAPRARPNARHCFARRHVGARHRVHRAAPGERAARGRSRRCRRFHFQLRPQDALVCGDHDRCSRDRAQRGLPGAEPDSASALLRIALAPQAPCRVHCCPSRDSLRHDRARQRRSAAQRGPCHGRAVCADGPRSQHRGRIRRLARPRVCGVFCGRGVLDGDPGLGIVAELHTRACLLCSGSVRDRDRIVGRFDRRYSGDPDAR